MTQHMHRDLDQIKRDVLLMGGLVEQGLQAGRLALRARDASKADTINRLELKIDRMQLDIDDGILKLLALHQPVAGDLRFVTAAMKIVNDLERIGDLSCTIANRLREVLVQPDLGETATMENMMAAAAEMVSRALNSFVQLDVQEALEVVDLDEHVNDYNRQHFETLIARMQQDPRSVRTAVGLLSISRSIERIGDLATNIAEDVVFISTAKDIRHPKLIDLME